MSRRSRERYNARLAARTYPPIVVPTEQVFASEEETKPDWTRKCEVCDATPIMPFTGMCGPCTFGEADTAGGNW